MCNTCTWGEQTPAHNIWYGVEKLSQIIIIHTTHSTQRPSSISLYTHTNTNINSNRKMLATKRKGNEHLSQNHAVLPTLLQQHNER